MAKYRQILPQLTDKVFLTDSGLETTLVFHDGMDLPCFASFDLLRTPEGTDRLRRYYRLHAGMAREAGLGFVLEGVTWRANPDWGAKLGYDAAALEEANRASVRLMEEIREEHETSGSPMVISGNIGPRGDGYVAAKRMTADEAEAYHRAQIVTLAGTAADFVSAFTINYVEEAIGIVRAAKASDIPVVISFTLETDGRLPSGQTLQDAIAAVDAETDGGPAYYMINCAHPTHFETILRAGEGWVERVRGIRANSSCRSHAELDEATDLDDGDPVELGQQYRELRTRLPQLTVLGGCCGTDHRHVAEIRRWCSPVEAEAA